MPSYTGFGRGQQASTLLKDVGKPNHGIVSPNAKSDQAQDIGILPIYHQIKHELPIQVFHSLQLKQLIRSEKSFFPLSKALRLFITKGIPSVISTSALINTNGFLCRAKITHEKFELFHAWFQNLISLSPSSINTSR